MDRPGCRPLPLADGSVNQGDRQQTAGTYRGIVAAPPGGQTFQSAWIMANAAVIANR